MNVEVLDSLALAHAALQESLHVLKEHVFELASLGYSFSSKHSFGEERAVGNIGFNLLEELQHFLQFDALEREVLQIVDLVGVAHLVLEHLEQEGH